MIKQNATKVPIPNEFDDDADFWPHEVCKNYESNRKSIVRHIKTKNIVGFKDKEGYINFTCNGDCCRGDKKNKKDRVNRFIFECFFGLIEDGYVIDHINNIHSDNRLENLQKITQSENLKKNNSGGLKVSQSIRAINVDNSKIYIYRSLYGAAKDLHLNSGNVHKVLNGLRKTILSKKLNQRFTFQRIDHDNEQLPLIIINKNKVINFKSNQINKIKC